MVQKRPCFRRRCRCSKRRRNFWGFTHRSDSAGRLPFALALAQILGREKSVLYLNMEEYSGFEELFEKEYPYTLSDLLYFVRQEQAGITVKMNSMIQSMGSMDFIPPVQSPEDIRGTRWPGLGAPFAGNRSAQFL